MREIMISFADKLHSLASRRLSVLVGSLDANFRAVFVASLETGQDGRLIVCIVQYDGTKGRFV